jgi:hypothetical protein
VKITYHPNPLRTVIELDPAELENFRLKVKLAEMSDLLFDAHFHLEEGAYFDLAKARDAVDPAYYLQDGDKISGLDERVELLVSTFVSDLAGTHIGDCTCFPASCTKCHAEEILGIDTIKGMGKHMGSKIFHAFEKHGTLDAVIESLENYAPERTPEWVRTDPSGAMWASCLPRWQTEANQAAAWLRAYRDEHFPR